jgi:hypothetical protein
VRKIIFLLSLCWVVATFAVHADTVTLADGNAFTGEILKFDATGLMLNISDGVYTNLTWGRISQDSLKQLSQNEKLNAKRPPISSFVEPFIEPTAPEHPAKAEITVKPVTRLDRPAHPSIILGMLSSPVGLFVLLVLYGANLFAAYEVALIRARTPGQVMGLAAILPVIAPIIFLWMPIKPKTVETVYTEVVTAPSGAGQNPDEEIPIVEVTHKVEEKKPEPQIFARGKFTFNKRFVETKFAGFIGEAKGDALTFTMEVRTTKATFAVERIMQVSATEVIFETVQPGQVTVLLTDIQEIKLNPKPASA